MIHECDVNKWAKSRILGRIWNCGADCNCSKAEILEVFPDRLRGYPWVLNRTIWESRMIVKPTSGDLVELREALEEAKKRFPVQEEI